MPDFADEVELVPLPLPSVKPGWQTSEFWIALVVQLVAFVLALLPPESPWVSVLSLVSAGFVALGYSSNRTDLKRRAMAALEAASTAFREPDSRQSAGGGQQRITPSAIAFLLILPALLCVGGCQILGGGDLHAQTDQARKTAVEPVIVEHIQRHPEEELMWLDFLESWQDSIDARRGD